MERTKKCIWGCVLGAVVCAVIIGVFYYVLDVRSTDSVNEGILISQMIPGLGRNGVYVFW